MSMVTPGQIFNIDDYMTAVEGWRATDPNVAVDYATALPAEKQPAFWEAFRARFIEKQMYGSTTYDYKVWAKVFKGVSDRRRQAAGIPLVIRQEIRIAILEAEKEEGGGRSRSRGSQQEEMCNCMAGRGKGPHPYGMGGPGSSCA